MTGRSVTEVQLRQVGLITAVAIGIFVGFRFLPTGTDLNHMDFRVNAKNAIEFCDPSNPQFIPVVAVRSPVTLSIRTPAAPTTGTSTQAFVTLQTANGKPVAAEDLVVAHTRKLHLLIVDPTLKDYQHVHPEPTKTRGEWVFSFTPRGSGLYRVFADFTPAATGRGLYASVDLSVAGGGVGTAVNATGTATSNRDYQFTLTSAVKPLRAGQTIDLSFAISRTDGGAVPLEPVMGAFAHLVAFDQERGGFAHLHPNETDLARPPEARAPVLTFKVTIPRAGTYVIWAQVNLGGQEQFVPFSIEVL